MLVCLIALVIILVSLINPVRLLLHPTVFHLKRALYIQVPLMGLILNLQVLSRLFY
nr:MAG TPA: hypothetical protein [Caudoviricetes sp.]